MEWEINEGQFGTDARKVHGKHMQDKESNGEKGGGDQIGHLGFGDVSAGHNRHRGGVNGNIWSRLTYCIVDNGGGGNQGMEGQRSQRSLQEEEHS